MSLRDEDVDGLMERTRFRVRYFCAMQIGISGFPLCRKPCRKLCRIDNAHDKDCDKDFGRLVILAFSALKVPRPIARNEVPGSLDQDKE
jgi:hypothetical protein